MRILFVLLLLWSEMGLSLDLKAIHDKYRDVKEISAEVNQTKTSPLLLRPLKSKVRLSFKDEILTWAVDGQEPWRIHFHKDGRAEFLTENKALREIPPEAKAKLDRTLYLVRKILVMDKGLDQDFSQTILGDSLVIAPKSKTSSVFFEDVVIEFKKDLSIQNIKLRTTDDLTLLEFQTLTLKSS